MEDQKPAADTPAQNLSSQASTYQATYDASQIYPTAGQPAIHTVPVSPSNLTDTPATKNRKLPIGIIILALIILMPAAINVFYWALKVKSTPTGVGNFVSQLALAVSFLIVLAGIGLLRLSETARQVFLFMASVSIMLGCWNLYKGLQVHHELNAVLNVANNNPNYKFNIALNNTVNSTFKKFFYKLEYPPLRIF